MSEVTFKQAMSRLNEIVANLEKNEIELEEAIVLYEEALHLVKLCDTQLNTFENKVADLLSSYQEGDQNE